MVGMSMKSLGVVRSSKPLKRTSEDLRGDLTDKALAEGHYVTDVCVAIAVGGVTSLGRPIPEGEKFDPLNCCECGEEISEKRRRYAPRAILCVRCQEMHEKK